MPQIAKHVYDEVAAAIRKLKDQVIADPATSHLLVAVITMQRELSRAFAESNSLFRPDMFATACEPLFRPGRMGNQPVPEPAAVTSGSEKSTAPLPAPPLSAAEKRLLDHAGEQERTVLTRQRRAAKSAEALLANARAAAVFTEPVPAPHSTVAATRAHAAPEAASPSRKPPSRAGLYGRNKRGHGQKG